MCWPLVTPWIDSEAKLASLAVMLGSCEHGGPLSADERDLVESVKKQVVDPEVVSAAKKAIESGSDPLGDAFARLRTPEVRRQQGATYTPTPIVEAMMEWAESVPPPDRVVDPGVGSARFLMQASSRFPQAHLFGVDTDPLATLMARANLGVLGVGDRVTVVNTDFRLLGPADCRTLFIGNPPYVRHHKISAAWKSWLSTESRSRGLPASLLSGLHVHFFLAIAKQARPGDFGALVTAAEWLDVNYGRLVRSLLVGPLGGRSVSVVEPTAQPFPDAATTAAITTFEVGAADRSIRVRRVDNVANLTPLEAGYPVEKRRLLAEPRWSHLTFTPRQVPQGFIELGELCRVHRGTVTGANSVWIAGAHSRGLPDSVQFPSVTRAREVLEADGLLADAYKLRRVIDIPADLGELDLGTRRQVEAFLKVARRMGAATGYVAEHRRAWWAVGLRAPAPIISTYMARRPPGFAVNGAHARHINIAHGLYPREPMSLLLQRALVAFLQKNVSQRSGRTYAGGLTKFEPREMERVLVPDLQDLSAECPH